MNKLRIRLSKLLAIVKGPGRNDLFLPGPFLRLIAYWIRATE